MNFLKQKISRNKRILNKQRKTKEVFLKKYKKRTHIKLKLTKEDNKYKWKDKTKQKMFLKLKLMMNI